MRLARTFGKGIEIYLTLEFTDDESGVHRQTYAKLTPDAQGQAAGLLFGSKGTYHSAARVWEFGSDLFR